MTQVHDSLLQAEPLDLVNCYCSCKNYGVLIPLELVFTIPTVEPGGGRPQNCRNVLRCTTCKPAYSRVIKEDAKATRLLLRCSVTSRSLIAHDCTRRAIHQAVFCTHVAPQHYSCTNCHLQVSMILERCLVYHASALLADNIKDIHFSTLYLYYTCF